MSRHYRLVALHGFLGRAADWDALGEWFPDASITAIDLWSVVGSAESADWAFVGRALDRALAGAIGEGDGEPAFVLAYSFGARLALASDLLAMAGSPARGCCLVSCNPGLASDDEQARDARRTADDEWARRILEWPVTKIWREWDAQIVFQGSRPPSPRAELPAPRTVLARVLRQLSLGAQPDFRPRLQRWSPPVLWMTGGLDRKFSGVARELAAAGAPMTFATCQGAGHRVPWDDPEGFARGVRNWIAQVMETSR